MVTTMPCGAPYNYIIIQVRLMTAKAQNIEAAESPWAGLDSLRYNR